MKKNCELNLSFSRKGSHRDDLQFRTWIAFSGVFCSAAFLGSALAAEKSNAPEAEPKKTLELPSKNPPPLVLQNRYFLKAIRPEANVFFGSILNESYSQTWNYGARLGMFFNETIGAEYTFSKFLANDSRDLEALRKLQYCNDNKTKCTNPQPSFVRLTGAHLGTVTFAPIYGKINFLDLGIVYSDIYTNLGGGVIGTSQGSKPAAVVGFGQRFYFAKNYNFRIDATNHIFSEERENLGEKKKAIKNAWSVTLGFSMFLSN